VGLSDDATLLEHIKKAIAESRFTGEGYRKIRARLRLFRHPQLARAGAAADGRAWAAGTHRVRRPDKAHDGSMQRQAQLFDGHGVLVACFPRV
jgi:hypothetical protein